MNAENAYNQVIGSLCAAVLLACAALFISGCSAPPAQNGEGADATSQASGGTAGENGDTSSASTASGTSSQDGASSTSAASGSASAAASPAPSADELRAKLKITKDYRDSFVHGSKGAKYQKYIVLHDTESDANASDIVNYWDSNGFGVAAHFVVNKDGTIVQCVPLDKIAHHAGFGDTGHNKSFKVTDESRDDKVGTTPIGSSFADYGMNSYSVGIELVHVGGSGKYPKAQLKALDGLIAYIDAYYGFESQITDHKAWRSGNSDTSKEFASYLASYQEKRTYK